MVYLLSFLLAGHAALAGVDPAIQTAVTELYGRPIPEKAICIAQTSLPEELAADVVPVGVLRGHRGCTLLGVMTRSGWTSASDALPASIESESWNRLKQMRQIALLETWTEQVLLGFDELDPSKRTVTQVQAGGGYRVDATFFQRTDGRHTTRHTRGSFYFDRSGTLETGDRSNGTSHKTTFYVQEYSVSGLTVAQVMQSLTQQGGTLRTCFEQAWSSDLTLENRTRLQWTIRSGKATQIAIVDDGMVHDELARCYANAIGRIEFADGIGGQVTWSFSIVRRPID